MYALSAFTAKLNLFYFNVRPRKLEQKDPKNSGVQEAQNIFRNMYGFYRIKKKKSLIDKAFIKWGAYIIAHRLCEKKFKIKEVVE